MDENMQSTEIIPTSAPQTSGTAHNGEVSDKSYLATFLFASFLGMFGVDRFYTGDIGLGIVKLLTLGGCGVWAFIDTILVLTGSRKDHFGRPLAGREQYLKLTLILFVVSLTFSVVLSIANVFLQASLLHSNSGLYTPAQQSAATPLPVQ